MPLQSTLLQAKPTALALSDNANPKALFVGAIFSSGLCFTLIGSAANLGVLRYAVVLLHFTHAPSWPGVAGLLCRWFPPVKRGFAYSFVSSQINIVSAVVPMVLSYLCLQFGSWRGAFIFLGTTISCMALSMSTLLSVPQEGNMEQQELDKICLEVSHSRQVSQETALASGPNFRLQRFVRRVQRVSLRELMSKQLACCMLIAFSSLTVYTFRFGIEFWISSFFADMFGKETGKKFSIAFIFWWQAGGTVGTLLVGPLTDKLGGDRLPAAMFCSFVALASVVLWQSTSLTSCILTACCAGCACFASRVLLMLAVRQAVPPKWGGRAEALNFLFAEFGGVCAGLPLISFMDSIGGMHSLRAVLIAVACAQGICLFLAWSVSTESKAMVWYLARRTRFVAKLWQAKVINLANSEMPERALGA